MSGLIFYEITLYKRHASLPPLLTPSFFLPLHAMAVAKAPPPPDSPASSGLDAHFVELFACKVESLLS